MTREELLQNCRYYKGEDFPPSDFDANSRLWWDGEKFLSDKINNDPSYWETISDLFHEAERTKSLSGILVDELIPKANRIVIFFLDIWHGKWYPYDNLDAINDY